MAQCRVAIGGFGHCPGYSQVAREDRHGLLDRLRGMPNEPRDHSRCRVPFRLGFVVTTLQLEKL